MNDNLWNVKRVAEFLCTTNHAIYKLIEKKKIPHMRLGRRVLFSPMEIREWLQKGAVDVVSSSLPGSG